MQPHEVDVHVGRKLRSRRTILGMSQEEIGEAVGITFQQVQKYERGLNRIGSSRLYEFARILGVSVSYFFEDLENGKSKLSEVTGLAENQHGFEYEKIDNKEILSFVRAYYGITDPMVRKKILALVKTLANVKDEEEEGDGGTAHNKSEKKKLANIIV